MTELTVLDPTPLSASEKGGLTFMDMRMATMSATSSSSKPTDPSPSYITKTVQAHSSGGVSALVSHINAPLLATGTTTQVVKVWTDQGETAVKVWTDQGETVGQMRAQSSSHGNKMGPVPAQSFQPLTPMLLARMLGWRTQCAPCTAIRTNAH
eukprot:gene20686-27482_t